MAASGKANSSREAENSNDNADEVQEKDILECGILACAMDANAEKALALQQQ